MILMTCRCKTHEDNDYTQKLLFYKFTCIRKYTQILALVVSSSQDYQEFFFIKLCLLIQTRFPKKMERLSCLTLSVAPSHCAPKLLPLCPMLLPLCPHAPPTVPSCSSHCAPILLPCLSSALRSDLSSSCNWVKSICCLAL